MSASFVMIGETLIGHLTANKSAQFLGKATSHSRWNMKDSVADSPFHREKIPLVDSDGTATVHVNHMTAAFRIFGV